jgi:hypothetical protein
MKPTVTITQLEFERNPNQFLWRAHFGTHFDIILESGTIICLTPPTPSPIRKTLRDDSTPRG